MDDFFVDLLTYTCPFTGTKRCAISAGLDSHPTYKKHRESLAEDDAWLDLSNVSFPDMGIPTFTKPLKSLM